MPVNGEVSALSVLLLGVSLGMTACAITCMPFIGTWALGRAESQTGAWRDTGCFLGGRLLAYSVLGGIAGGLGAWFVKQLDTGMGNMAIGMAAIFAAAWLAWPSPTRKSCGFTHRMNGLSPFLLGSMLTLIPCAPLATLLAASAAGGSIGRGAYLGMLFGLGALMTPMLVMIPVAAGFGRHLRQECKWIAPWLRCGAATTLLILGKGRLDSLAAGLFPYIAAVAGVFVAWAYYRRRASTSMEISVVRIAASNASCSNAH